MQAPNHQPFPWRLFLCELSGTAALVLVGLSFVIGMSGTSTNPARSLGPALLAGQWQGWWIYWVGPLFGAFLASLACSLLAKRITVAKLYYFDSDRDGLFRRMGSTDPAGGAAVLIKSANL